MEYEIDLSINTYIHTFSEKPITSRTEFKTNDEGLKKLLSVVNGLSDLQLTLKEKD